MEYSNISFGMAVTTYFTSRGVCAKALKRRIKRDGASRGGYNLRRYDAT